MTRAAHPVGDADEDTQRAWLNARPEAIEEIWKEDNPGRSWKAFREAASCSGTLNGGYAYVAFVDKQAARIEARTRELMAEAAS